MKEIAERAGVHPSTVDKVVHHRVGVSDEVRARVQAIINELGYTPNVSARNLSAKKPPNIGLIVSGLLEGNQKDNLVYLLLQGVLSYATKHRLEIALYTTDSQEQRKRSYTEFCAQHSISGTILSGITTDDAYFSELMDSGIPTVAVDVPMRDRMNSAAAHLLDACAFSATVDHHAYDERMTDLAYVDPASASTTMLVWELAGLMGAERGAELATCCYTGLVTDTGRFQYQNTDAAALAAASSACASAPTGGGR